MPRTRAQEKAAEQADPRKRVEELQNSTNDVMNNKNTNHKPAPKRKSPPSTPISPAPDPKAPKTTTSSSPPSPSPAHAKLSALLSTAPPHPLPSLALSSPTSASPSTLLAHLLHALVSSARISHTLALRTAETLVAHNYHDFETLAASTWDERIAVLNEGGYARYREKMGSELGELVEWLAGRYAGDLGRLREEAEREVENEGEGEEERRGKAAEGIRRRLKEVKGLGDVGVGIFCDTAQGLWPVLAPFVDERGREEMETLGLGTVEEVWEAVGRDAAVMARVVAGLTKVRLEKGEEEVEEMAEREGKGGTDGEGNEDGEGAEADANGMAVNGVKHDSEEKEE